MEKDFVLSLVIVVDKLRVSGAFDMMKAMLVADKKEQVAELYPNTSSLMVVIKLVMTCLVITAVKVGYVVAKIDTKSEFVQALLSVEAAYLLQGL